MLGLESGARPDNAQLLVHEPDVTDLLGSLGVRAAPQAIVINVGGGVAEDALRGVSAGINVVRAPRHHSSHKDTKAPFDTLESTLERRKKP